MSLLLKWTERIDQANTAIGRTAAWCMPFMALSTFMIVVLRYFFDLGWVWTQEAVIYMHGALFMLMVGYTLSQNDHVQIDIFYSKMSPQRQALVNLLGVTLFLVPFCLFMLAHSIPYTWNSWVNWEDSPEAGGIPAVFVLKLCLVLMPFLLLTQGFSLGVRSFLVLFAKQMTTAQKSIQNTSS